MLNAQHLAEEHYLYSCRCKQSVHTTCAQDHLCRQVKQMLYSKCNCIYF